MKGQERHGSSKQTLKQFVEIQFLQYKITKIGIIVNSLLYQWDYWNDRLLENYLPYIANRS